MEKKNILFIEDDMSTIEVYKTALEEADFDVDPMTSGEEAVRRMKEIEQGEAKKPDFVLPDINGIEELKEIRKYERTKNLTVFILTNYTDEELKDRGVYLRAEKYLLKTSYAPRELASLIKKELEKQKKVKG